MCLNIGTPNNHHFPFGTNEKVVVLEVPILTHFRVFQLSHLTTASLMSQNATAHLPEHDHTTELNQTTR